jgi:hypothetical protein
MLDSVISVNALDCLKLKRPCLDAIGGLVLVKEVSMDDWNCNYLLNVVIKAKVIFKKHVVWFLHTTFSSGNCFRHFFIQSLLVSGSYGPNYVDGCGGITIVDLLVEEVVI